MRIGIYDPYLDDLGGGEKYMMTIAVCLSSNHEVSVFWDNEKDVDALKKRFDLSLENVSLRKNIFSPHVGIWERLLATQKYDAIIVLSDGSVPVTLTRKLFLHVQQPLNLPHAASFKSMFKFGRISKIFYNSEFTQSYNKEFFSGVKTEVIYPPVRVEAASVTKENIILHVGRFRVKNVANEDYKKQSVMVDAFKAMIDKELKGWKFIIAASVKTEDEGKFAQLQESAKGYPIEFLLNKANDELFAVYNKAKIYWHASGFGEDLEKYPDRAEHFGISTVEAMGAGAVPVVINAGGQKEIVTDGKNGLLWNSLEELQEKTKELINDESRLTALSQQAKIRAKDFTREAFCQKIHKLIEQ